MLGRLVIPLPLDPNQDYWEARAEAAERLAAEWEERYWQGSEADGEARRKAERERDYYRKFAHERHEQYMECQATLAAVREEIKPYLDRATGLRLARRIASILDGEVEK